MGKTEEDWNGLKLGFLKTVQPNSFSKLMSAVCSFKNNAFTYFKFHSGWGRVIGKIKQNELDCRDTAPLNKTETFANNRGKRCPRPEGGPPRSRHFQESTHVNFKCVNKIEAMYQRPRVTHSTFNLYTWPSILCLYYIFTYVNFNTRTTGKIHLLRWYFCGVEVIQHFHLNCLKNKFQ